MPGPGRGTSGHIVKYLELHAKMFGVDLIFRFGGTGKDFNPTINFQIFFDDISGS